MYILKSIRQGNTLSIGGKMNQRPTSKINLGLALTTLLTALGLGTVAIIVYGHDYLRINSYKSFEMYVLLGSIICLMTIVVGVVSSANMKSLKQYGLSRQVQSLESISSEIRESIEDIVTLTQNGTTVDRFDSALSYILSQLESMRDSVDTFISSNSSDRLSTEYDSYAKREKRTAIVYDMVAILLSVSGAAIAFISSFKVGTFTASGFVFRRGTFHHREAKAAMRTALSLSQYRAFTANLPDDVKDRIEIDIAERVFSKGEIDHTEDRLVDVFSRRGVSISELSDLIKLFRETSAS